MAAIRKNIWMNIIFFAVTTGAALLGCPGYIAQRGLSAPLAGLTLFYLAATGLAITAGYHRLFAHSSYRAHPLVRLWFLFFGAAAFEQSALMWSSQHRDHHRYVDTDQDPYSIKKGFFYAHMGWLMFWEHEMHYENAKDLHQDDWVMRQHRGYLLWAVVAGVFTPVLIGSLFGEALGAFLFAVCLRLTIVYHSTFCINSVCHVFGKSTYDVNASARDHWLVALITYGEGYHNFHHKFPVDYRNGVRWYDFDPSKWLIQLLATVKLARGLKRTSDFRIIEARLTGERNKAVQTMKRMGAAVAYERAAQQLTDYHARLREQLGIWEDAVGQYKILVRSQALSHSRELMLVARCKIEEAKHAFSEISRPWAELMALAPKQLQDVLSARRFESLLPAA